LKKANQKRHLGNLAIEDGNFNIDGLKEEQLRTLVEVLRIFMTHKIITAI